MNTTDSTSPSVEGKPSAHSPAKPGSLSINTITDLICFSHLRWNFVYQRPQHLLSRAAAGYRVWFLEEPVRSDQTKMDSYQPLEGVTVLTPHIPHHIPADEAVRLQRQLLDEFVEQKQLTNFISWYYTPMALLFSDHLKPRLTVYDCMDELSAFWGAPPQLLQQEQRLLDRSAIVFTGGISLYEAKQNRHPQVMAFPSSIDFKHFSQARQSLSDPADQAPIAKPRIGFSGVIDERFDYELVGKLAEQHPDWQFVLIGPIVKIDRNLLPKAANVHYPGMKDYKELPAYFSNWDVAILRLLSTNRPGSLARLRRRSTWQLACQLCRRRYEMSSERMETRILYRLPIQLKDLVKPLSGHLQAVIPKIGSRSTGSLPRTRGIIHGRK